jgi:DHA1 family bicyclomycin/chloramphenicol resistance-like MFS transporter
MRPSLSTAELVAMVAALGALNAMSIDVMLPALPQIGDAYALTTENNRQFVLTAYLAAFGLSQLIYGPLTDAFGRRVVLLWALGLFLFGAALSVVAPSFSLFLAARALQGLGAGATRVVSMAVVRDLTEGRRMAQIMSMAMTVFMIVPIVAPSIGQLILFVAPWRWIFGVLLIYGALIFVWTLLRLPETLRPENTTPFRPQAIAGAYLSILRLRQFVGYTIASTFIGACLMGYITASEQLFVDVYGLGAAFPLAFAAVAIAMSAGTFANSRIVMRYGMRRISHTMVLAFIVLATLLAGLVAAGWAPFWVFLAMLCITLGPFGLIGGNFNALAMEPVGRIAGSAATLYGATTATGGAVIGVTIAHQFDGTALPFAIGITLAALVSLATVLWAERGVLFRGA